MGAIVTRGRSELSSLLADRPRLLFTLSFLLAVGGTIVTMGEPAACAAALPQGFYATAEVGGRLAGLARAAAARMRTAPRRAAPRDLPVQSFRPYLPPCTARRACGAHQLLPLQPAHRPGQGLQDRPGELAC